MGGPSVEAAQDRAAMADSKAVNEEESMMRASMEDDDEELRRAIQASLQDQGLQVSPLLSYKKKSNLAFLLLGVFYSR
jgi:hypothetical protein